MRNVHYLEIQYMGQSKRQFEEEMLEFLFDNDDQSWEEFEEDELHLN